MWLPVSWLLESVGDAAGSVLGMAKELIRDRSKVPGGTSAERLLASRGQALEHLALKLQIHRLITQKALDAKWFNITAPETCRDRE